MSRLKYGAWIMLNVVAVVELGEVVTEDEMIAAFAKGEIDSPRYGRSWQELLLNRWGRPRSLVDHPDLSNPVENNIRRDLLTAFRGYPDTLLFQGFPSNVIWHRGSVQRGGVGNLLYANFSTWVRISENSRLVRDGAANVDRIAIGDDGTNGFIREAERLIAGGTDLGKPLLVGTDRDGPFVVLEGHARATGHALNSALPGFVPVLVGLSLDIATWSLW
jgi:hypothetical protein